MQYVQGPGNYFMTNTHGKEEKTKQTKTPQNRNVVTAIWYFDARLLRYLAKQKTTIKKNSIHPIRRMLCVI